MSHWNDKDFVLSKSLGNEKLTVLGLRRGRQDESEALEENIYG
jgi:hypothetical protein